MRGLGGQAPSEGGITDGRDIGIRLHYSADRWIGRMSSNSPVRLRSSQSTPLAACPPSGADNGRCVCFAALQSPRCPL